MGLWLVLREMLENTESRVIDTVHSTLVFTAKPDSQTRPQYETEPERGSHQSRLVSAFQRFMPSFWHFLDELVFCAEYDTVLPIR